MTNRRSFQGIAETWVAPGEGIQKPFVKRVMKVLLDCEILADVNDIFSNIGLLLNCDVSSDNAVSESAANINLDCIVKADEHDVFNTATSISLSCFVDVL